MARLEGMAAWFFSCLAAALAAAAIVVVPGTAFADPGSDCATKCSGDPNCGAPPVSSPVTSKEVAESRVGLATA